MNSYQKYFEFISNYRSVIYYANFSQKIRVIAVVTFTEANLNTCLTIYAIFIDKNSPKIHILSISLPSANLNTRIDLTLETLGGGGGFHPPYRIYRDQTN